MTAGDVADSCAVEEEAARLPRQLLLEGETLISTRQSERLPTSAMMAPFSRCSRLKATNGGRFGGQCCPTDISLLSDVLENNYKES